MNAQDVILGSRVAHLRELKTEIEKLKQENVRLRAECAELRGHFDLALLAARDLEGLPPGGTFILVDGWNLILGAEKEGKNPRDLIARMTAHLVAHPLDFVWIVFDGPEERVLQEGRLRVSYTGGVGLHRADRFIVDFVRMARFRGFAEKIEVRTHDKDLLKSLARLKT